MFLYKTTRISIILGTLLLLLSGGCSNSSAIETLVSADPQLKGAAEAQTVTDNQTTTGKPAQPVNPSDSNAIASQSQPTADTRVDLPENFPQDIPIYQGAKLQATEPGLTIDAGEIKLRTPDAPSQITDFYQGELATSGWEIIQPFVTDADRPQQKAIAIKDDLKITIAVAQGEEDTKLNIAYEPVKEELQISNTETETNNSPVLPIKTETNTNNPASWRSPNVQNQDNLPSNSLDDEVANTASDNFTDLSDADFSDLDRVPEQIRKYVEDVAALGILTPYTGENNTDLTKFAPNQPVTRSEYASWLIAANNKYYSDNPGNKIHVATKTNKPAFQDININDPDFGAIQGLAEAGLVPSMLTADSSKLLFQPDAPLKREDLILWKVPLDVRKTLPKASVEAISETWGFQDAANIEPNALRALFADYQNSDRSNVKRMLGYTTLFQPKKPVTRAEAAASLWYFGFQGDGITAPEVLKINN